MVYPPRMMSHRIPILVATALIALAGCTHHAEGGADHGDGHAAEPAVHDDHAPADLELTLDDGKKWPVDDHTRASAAAMIELVNGTEPFESVDDARAMAGALDGELQELIAGCTMEGAAHDQLHVVLAALFPRLGELKTGEDVALRVRGRGATASCRFFGGHRGAPSCDPDARRAV